MSAQTIEMQLPAFADTTAEAIAREKSHFLARNADRCTHLVVRIVSGEQEDLVIRAAFTLDEVRTWHEVEAIVASRELTMEAGPDRGLITAFGQLDDGISTARIARLFAPLTVEQRLAADRA